MEGYLVFLEPCMIEKVQVEKSLRDSNRVRPVRGICYYYTVGEDFFWTKEEAIQAFLKMKTEKIESLQKRILNLQLIDPENLVLVGENR